MATDSWSPTQYEKFKDQRKQPFFDLMEMVQPCARPLVVDLGCGTGELTAELHQKLGASQTVGIDSSESMLAKASTLTQDGLSFENQKIEDWHPTQKVDFVFSNAAIQWCSDHAQVVDRIKQNLLPGGQIAIQMPMNHDYRTHALAATMSKEEPWFSLMKGEIYGQKEQVLKPEEYASLLFRLGFHEQKVLMRVYGHVLESRIDVVEWVKGTLLTHFKSRLSSEDYSRFLEEYRMRLFEMLPDESPYFYPFKRVLIWGRMHS